MKVGFVLARSLAVAPLALAISAAAAQPSAPVTYQVPAAVILPLTVGWFNGEPAPYISTEASDPAVARMFHANYVPRLANAANTQAIDNIYMIVNYKQENVIPSAPHPAGPNNTDPNYTPLWQVTQVTWNAGTTPYLLTSEHAILDAQAKGLVSITLTNIVVNCSVIFTPQGGLLPRATLLKHYKY